MCLHSSFPHQCVDFFYHIFYIINITDESFPSGAEEIHFSVVHEQTSKQKAQTLHCQPSGTGYRLLEAKNMHIHLNEVQVKLWGLMMMVVLLFQWTPKDDLAVLKIHGKCDDVMRLLMKELNIQIPAYNR